uniref:Uncharacterized protein n=1 Tax=Triticum urartu TaxID=4572 RepID=A0A8R7TF25_TRIUA
MIRHRLFGSTLTSRHKSIAVVYCLGIQFHARGIILVETLKLNMKGTMLISIWCFPC